MMENPALLMRTSTGPSAAASSAKPARTRSAVQADGRTIDTVESLGRIGQMNALQDSFHQHHALQCGFCTPGMLMTATDLLKKYPLATDDDIRQGLSGNLCRCTGYEHIVKAIRAVAGKAGATR